MQKPQIRHPRGGPGARLGALGVGSVLALAAAAGSSSARPMDPIHAVQVLREGGCGGILPPVRRLEQDGVIKGYVAVFDPDDVGLPLTAFVSIKPFDAAAPDDVPQRLEHLAAIEACHSVAGDENYILKVRVPTPAALEDLLQQIRTIGGVSTRTTVVLSTPYENRPPDI